MDPMIAKLVNSRRKSIATLNAEIDNLSNRIKLSTVPAATSALESVRLVKVQRRDKLEAELAGLVQLELPGTSSPIEAAPGPVMGKGSPPR